MSSVANGLCAACKPALATATSVKDKTRAPGPGTGTSRRSAAAAVGLSSSLQHNIFLTTMFRRTPFRKDGLEAYLEAPPLGTVEDSIEYWELRAQTDGEQHCPRAHAAGLPIRPGCVLELLSITFRLILTSLLASDINEYRARLLLWPTHRLPPSL